MPDAAAAVGAPHIQVLQHVGAAFPRGVGGEVQRVAHHAGRAARAQLRHLAAERRRLRLEAVALQLWTSANM